MRRIEPLAETVRSSVRSGIILYDLSRVVEELIFNSLDAGATKIYVAVGVATSFVKVVDNGYGVDRDGLMLLGERYATSRHGHFDALGSRGSFGFHGEALSSIADVSLLEITTKAPAMPHGYRKVIKGCKCLYLGINDDKREVGTTVVVRDLFYNQPVRRKQMQSSPKKVLHLVKKCVLRIALVHSAVSFRVADVESDADLLRTGSSPSPLQLLASNFGIEANKHLQEIEAGEGEMRLSGYISGPFGISSLKALQYIYINSRFVCKGPIHKLLNQLGSGYVDERKSETAQHEKRSRSNICPTFVLYLSCPRSYYEITFEPTKNLVEFRDWGSVLHFVQNAVTRFWMESTFDDFLHYTENTTKRRRKQKWRDPLDIPPLDKQKQVADWDELPSSVENLPSSNISDEIASAPQKLQKEALVIHDISNVIPSFSSSIFQLEAEENEHRDGNMHLYGRCLSDKYNAWQKDFCLADLSNINVGSSIVPRWQEEDLEAGEKRDNLLSAAEVLNNRHEFTDDAQVNGHFKRSCQFSYVTPRDLPHYVSSSTVEVRFQSDTVDLPLYVSSSTGEVKFEPDTDDLGVLERRSQYVEPDNSNEKDDIGQMFGENFARQDKAKKNWLFSKCTTLRGIGLNLKSLSPEARCFDEEKHIGPNSLQINQACSSTNGWPPLTLSPLIDTSFRDFDNFYGDVFGSTSEYDNDVCFPHLQGNKGYSVSPVVQSWGDDDLPIIRCKEDFFNDELYNSPRGNNNKFRGHESKSACLQTSSKVIDHRPDSPNLSFLSLSKQSNTNRCRRVRARKGGRSLSAPPFYRHRKKFYALDSYLKISAEKIVSPATNKDTYFPGGAVKEPVQLKHEHSCVENGNVRYRQASNCQSPLSSKPLYVDDSFYSAKKLESPDRKITEPRKCSSSFLGLDEGLARKEREDILDYDWKLHNNFAENEGGVKSCSTKIQDAILDINSGILHLSGDLLVPNSISRNNLEEARVLLQVDKKFIPVVAGQTLAIVDQHAADERIRLEELRKKILSGEMKEITYLEAEQELVLPEIGYQLLHNYSKEIESWGWICKIDGEGSRSFRKSLNVLSRQQTTAKLVAVPCILGVKMTDLDLMEFLQQLADTDGSSMLPPSVHRVLNNKACRGAIMFGDTLLPSECSLIVEELKQTSLCFQCAHGRPTTVPLVDLAVLHRKIDSLGLCSRDTQESWHGLHRHEISLARAAHRLSPSVD